MNSRTPSSISRSIGIGLLVRGRSLSVSVGIFASASGGVGLLLQRLELGRGLGHVRQLLRRHRRLGRIEPRPLLGRLARRLAGIGVEQHGGAVLVGEQALVDQRLEHPGARRDAVP